MPRKGKNILRGYESANLVFFLGFILALGGFVFYIFHSYKSENDKLMQRVEIDDGIQSVVLSAATNSCLFYLADKYADSNHTYRSVREIPANDDGLLKDLFGISGVTQVVVDERLIVVSKAPSSHWEMIQPTSKDIIAGYIQKRRDKAAATK
jgi:hypothetical protein